MKLLTLMYCCTLQSYLYLLVCPFQQYRTACNIPTRTPLQPLPKALTAYTHTYTPILYLPPFARYILTWVTCAHPSPSPFRKIINHSSFSMALLPAPCNNLLLCWSGIGRSHAFSFLKESPNPLYLLLIFYSRKGRTFNLGPVAFLFYRRL